MLHPIHRTRRKLVHHKRVIKQTYQYVLNKMNAMLANWNANTLSIVSKHTLISFVVLSILDYTMQTSLLLMITCNEIDKKCMNFP